MLSFECIKNEKSVYFLLTSTISQQFWTFYLILLLVRSNPPHFLTQFGLPHASSPLQRPIRHHSSTAYYTPPANPPHKSLP